VTGRGRGAGIGDGASMRERAMAGAMDTEGAKAAEKAGPTAGARFKWIGWSSLFLALVQSACSAFVALSGIRLLAGIAAVVFASSAWKLADRMHVRDIRLPMMGLALAGAVFGLASVWQARRLRGRESAAWRQQPVPKKKIYSENLQIALAVATLVLLALETWFHVRLHGGL
jgi:hypothetical protein